MHASSERQSSGTHSSPFILVTTDLRMVQYLKRKRRLVLMYVRSLSMRIANRFQMHSVAIDSEAAKLP